MKLLIVHCKKFKIVSFDKATRPRNIVHMKGDISNRIYKNILVVYCSVMSNDSGEVVDSAIRIIEAITNSINIDKVCIIPFAHLSKRISNDHINNINILRSIKNNLQHKGYKIVIGDYGFHNEVTMVTYKHSLSFVYRDTDDV